MATRKPPARKGPRKWTDAENQKLTDWWNANITIHEIARKLRRQPSTVSQQRKKLGLPDRRQAAWTPEEKGLLERATRAIVEDLCTALDRTPSAVASRMMNFLAKNGRN